MSDIKYSRKKYLKPWQIFVISALFALILLLTTFLVIYSMGYRYFKTRTDDGYIKFLGKVNSSGTPISGTLYYSNGIKGEIDMREGKVTYSDGTE